MRSAGIENAAVMPTAGHPVVYGEWLGAGPDKPTVLVYGHYDAVPAAKADGSSVGEAALGVGVGVAINTADSRAEANLGRAAIVTSDGLSLRARMPEEDAVSELGAEAVSGGGSRKVGIAGSLGLNRVNTTADASMLAGSSLDAGEGDVSLSAANVTSSTARGLPSPTGTTGSSLGFGASVAINIADNRTRSELEPGALLSRTGDVSLSATFVRRADPRFVLAFSIPTNSPGLKILCREPVSQGLGGYGHPLGMAYDEQDAMLFFDHVLVPWDRLFALYDSAPILLRYQSDINFIGWANLCRIHERMRLMTAVATMIAEGTYRTEVAYTSALAGVIVVMGIAAQRLGIGQRVVQGESKDKPPAGANLRESQV